MPNCRITLVLDETEKDGSALIGELAHMIAEKEDGPRGSSALTPEQRDLYDNLLLLCRNHHGEIDRQPESWPVARLQQIKADHEAWVSQSLFGFDKQRQKDDETYASYIDEWEKLCRLELWTGWTSTVFASGQPSLDSQMDQDLAELCRWTIKRIWPGRYIALEAAIQNFALVAEDFRTVFHKHAEKPYPNVDTLWTRKFYRINEWNPDLYHRLLRQYEYHVELVQDLALELTRAGNLVCDQVRTHVLASYRLVDGRLSIESGPYEDLTWKEFVVEYNGDERAAVPPYPGLEAFLIGRVRRDMHFGQGALLE
jgi:hypothetical protein